MLFLCSYFQTRLPSKIPAFFRKLHQHKLHILLILDEVKTDRIIWNFDTGSVVVLELRNNSVYLRSPARKKSSRKYVREQTLGPLQRTLKLVDDSNIFIAQTFNPNHEFFKGYMVSTATQVFFEMISITRSRKFTTKSITFQLKMILLDGVSVDSHIRKYNADLLC